MPGERPAGIDLGASFSAAAWIDEASRTHVVRNTEGELFTPSVVWFSKQGVVVGRDARFASITHPHLVFEGVKRELGRPFCSRSIHGWKFPPEVIQACILRKLREDIVRESGSVPQAAIAAPASFGDLQRRATLAAAEMAGLQVRGLVNEPMAATIHFHEMLQQSADGAMSAKETIVLLYSLGGAFFDVGLFRLKPNEIQAIAFDGDARLGGQDWDLRIVNHLAHRFLRLYHRDLRRDRAVFNRVMAAVINAKHALSSRERMTVRIEFFGRILEVSLSRSRLESMTTDFVERSTNTVQRLLSTAGMDWKDISRVLLVGGAARMPMIAEVLRKLSNLEPELLLNADEAVVRGAARYAAWLLGEGKGDSPLVNMSIVNICSHALGMKLVNSATAGSENATLIPRNTPLPVRYVQRFLTATENQREIAVVLLEDNPDQPEQWSVIGRAVIRNLPGNLPEGHPVNIAFSLETNGLLTVEAVLPESEMPLQAAFEPAYALSPAQIVRWRQTVEGAGELSTFEAALKATARIPQIVSVPAPAVKASVVRPRVEKEQKQPLTADTSVSGGNISPGPATTAVLPTEMENLDSTSPEIDTRLDSVSTEPQTEVTAPLPEPRWRLVVRLVGHVVAAAMGLLLGYLILHRLRPTSFPFPPW